MDSDLSVSKILIKNDVSSTKIEDLSYSMMVDNYDNNRNQAHRRSYDTIQPKTRIVWQEDNSVYKCSCGTRFGYLERKHHCRLCCKVFCDNCSKYRSSIPEYVDVPTPPKAKQFTRDEDVRLCKPCHEKITQLKQVENLIQVFNLLKLDIYDFKKMKLVCKSWNQFSNFCLSKFRDIQYLPAYHKYNKYEKDMLWINRKYFLGHAFWMTHLLRSVDYKNNPETIPEVVSLLQEHSKLCEQRHNKEKMDKKYCWELMCKRQCRQRLNSECCFMLLDPNYCVGVNEIKQFAMDSLLYTYDNGIKQEIDVEELCNYIQYLIHAESIMQNNVILDSLINEINKFEIGKGVDCIVNQRCIRIACEIYMEIIIGLQNKSVFLIQIYKNMYEKLKANISLPFWNILLQSEDFVEKVKNSYNRNDSLEIIKAFSKHNNVVNPLYPESGDMTVLAAQIEMKDSITKPVVIPLMENNNVNDLQKHHKIMYKKEDVRKDQIVMSIIKLMSIILKKELGIDLGIITYRVRPTSPNEGFIEFVQQCTTLYKIQQTGMTLQNYILEQNRDLSQQTIRTRFIKSCAAYCVMTYLLGVGDRHLENIMVSNDGRLFHIDYGFVLGQDPKPIKVSHIRISSEMLDALGGYQSRDYEVFKKLCDKIYNILRANVNLFICILSLFSQVKPKIDGAEHFSERKIIREINRRFCPGESYQEATIILHNQIEDSTASTTSYKYALIDFFHKHNKEQTIRNGISYTANNAQKLTKKAFSKIWDFIVSKGTLDE